MRVATLQFAPVMGEVEANIAWADALIARAGLEDGEGKVDLLVLPELAFSGGWIFVYQLYVSSPR